MMSESDDDDLDPRIQVELEKLNALSQEINSLESEFSKARNHYQNFFTESSQRLAALRRQCGDHVEKAKPYYDARQKGRIMQDQTQEAAHRFERACSELAAAKETVEYAEEGYRNRKQKQFDPAWQEVINQSTSKVNDAENERLLSSIAHESVMAAYSQLEQEIRIMEKSLKKSITKSKPYFELYAKFNGILGEQRKFVEQLKDAVKACKDKYAQTLHGLEEISEEIHQRRRESQIRKEMGERQAGVGSEDPDGSLDPDVSLTEGLEDGTKTREKLKAAGVVFDERKQEYVLLNRAKRTVSMTDDHPHMKDEGTAVDRPQKAVSTRSLEISLKEKAFEIAFEECFSGADLQQESAAMTRSASENNILEQVNDTPVQVEKGEDAVVKRAMSLASPGKSSILSDSARYPNHSTMLSDDAIDNLNLKLEHVAVQASKSSQSIEEEFTSLESKRKNGSSQKKRVKGAQRSSVTDGVLLECTKL